MGKDLLRVLRQRPVQLITPEIRGEACLEVIKVLSKGTSNHIYTGMTNTGMSHNQYRSKERNLN